MTCLIILITVGLIIFVVFIRLIKPNRNRITSVPTQFFAHRGLHNKLIPENSLTAFQEAKNAGVGVELDIQLTRDKQVVVFHDSDLERMCGVDLKVSDLTYQELRKYRLGSTDEKIPLLQNVLTILKETPIICEIKPHGGNTNTEICEQVCKEIANYQGEVWVESFSPFIVRWFRLNQPEIIRGQLSMDFIKKREGLSVLEAVAMKQLLINILSKPDFIAYRHDHDSLGFFLVRKLFRPLLVAWTITDKQQLHTAEQRFSAFIYEDMIL